MSMDTSDTGLQTLMQEYRTHLRGDVVTAKLDVHPAAANLPDLTPTTPEPTAEEALEEAPSEELQWALDLPPRRGAGCGCLGQDVRGEAGAG